MLDPRHRNVIGVAFADIGRMWPGVVREHLQDEPAQGDGQFCGRGRGQ
jgi:hypothetical protein